MTKRFPVLLAALAVVSACKDHPLPTQTDASSGSGLAQIASEAHAGFTFLAPIDRAPVISGEFNPDLPVSVDVCATAACTGSGRLAEFTTTAGGGSETVRVDPAEEAYIVNWNTRQYPVVAGGVYPVRVRVGTVVMGGIDVRVVANGSELGRVPAGEVGVVRNQTLPIRFRIAKGGIDAGVVGRDGGTVESSDGTLSLELPSGALGTETVITVQPLATPVDPDDRVIGGTAFQFGPSGTQFNAPVTISVRVDPSAIPAGVSPRLLRIHRLVGDTWELLPGGEVDAATGTVSAQTSSFSSYAVLPAAFASISAGEYHACGLTAGGQAWCWGANEAGQLGAFTLDMCAAGAPCNPIATEVRGGLTFRSIDAGTVHTCGVTTSDEAYCWGSNAQGQLGTGTTVGDLEPQKVSGGLRFTSVSAQFQHSCGVTTGGEVYCWGGNGSNQVGSTTSETCMNGVPCSTVPVRVTLPPVAEVGTGLVHTCARTAGGDAYCWGGNSGGQIGTGARTGPVGVTLISGGPWKSISAGALHTCGINDADLAFCWGSDIPRSGALGDGSRNAQFSPVAVAGGLRFREIAAANGNYIYGHSCGIAANGRMYCWGSNLDGALGVPAAPEQCSYQQTATTFVNFDCAFTPNPIASTLAFTKIATGLGSTCGYTRRGDVYCWGRNDRGQMGDGTTINRRTPVRVATAR